MTDGWTPVHGPTPPRRPQSLRGLGQAVIILTVAALMAQVVQGVFLQGPAPILHAGGGPVLEGAAWAAVTFLLAVLGWAQIGVSLAWMYRASENVTRFGMRDRRWGPGWALGAWFIPLANLVLPLFALNEIWRGSEPQATPQDWTARPASALVGWMWGFWVAQQVMGYAFGVWSAFGTFRSALRDTASPVDLGFAMPLAVAAAALYVVAGILYILFVRHVGDMQAQRMGRRMPAAPF